MSISSSLRSIGKTIVSRCESCNIDVPRAPAGRPLTSVVLAAVDVSLLDAVTADVDELTLDEPLLRPVTADDAAEDTADDAPDDTLDVSLLTLDVLLVAVLGGSYDNQASRHTF